MTSKVAVQSCAGHTREHTEEGEAPGKLGTKATLLGVLNSSPAKLLRSQEGPSEDGALAAITLDPVRQVKHRWAARTPQLQRQTGQPWACPADLQSQRLQHSHIKPRSLTKLLRSCYQFSSHER